MYYFLWKSSSKTIVKNLSSDNNIQLQKALDEIVITQFPKPYYKHFGKPTLSQHTAKGLPKSL